MGGIGSGRKKIELPVEVNVTGADALGKLKDDLVSAKGANDNLAGSFEDLTKTGGKLPGIFGSVSEGVGGLASSIGTATKAAITFIATPLGAVLAVIAAAIGAVSASFKNSEEGQNKFAKISAVIGSILQGLVDVLATVGGYIIDVFSNPIESIQKFAQLIKENIVNRFDGLLELIPALGKAVNQLFHGDFKEAGKTAFDATAKITTGVANMSNKISEASDALDKWGKKVKSNTDIAIEVSNKKAEADIKERDFIEIKAKLERDIAAAKDKAADKEHKNSAERKQDLEDVDALEKQLYGQEKEHKQLRAEIAVQESAIHAGDKEWLTKVAEAHAAVTEAETAELEAHKTNEKAKARVDKEIAGEYKKAVEEKKKAQEKAEKELKEKLKKDREDRLKTVEAQKEQDQIEGKSTAADEIAILQTKLDNILQNEESSDADRLKAQADFNLALNKINGKAWEEEIKAADEKAKNDEIRDKEAGKLYKQGLEEKKKADEEYSKAKLSVEKSTVEGMSALNDILSSDAEQAKEIQKGIALAQIGIDTAKAISSLVAASNANPLNSVTFGAAGIAQMAAGVAGIIVNIAKAKQLLSSNGNTSSISAPSAGSSAGAASTSAPTSSFVPPQIQNMGNNQANGSSSTSGQNDGVTRAYVVSSDISKSQNKRAILARRTSF